MSSRFSPEYYQRNAQVVNQTLKDAFGRFNPVSLRRAVDHAQVVDGAVGVNIRLDSESDSRYIRLLQAWIRRTYRHPDIRLRGLTVFPGNSQLVCEPNWVTYPDTNEFVSTTIYIDHKGGVSYIPSVDIMGGDIFQNYFGKPRPSFNPITMPVEPKLIRAVGGVLKASTLAQRELVLS